jgi:hypothetical protein
VYDGSLLVANRQFEEQFITLKTLIERKIRLIAPIF